MSNVQPGTTVGAPAALLLASPASLESGALLDWGPVPTPLGQPVSQMRGRLLHRDPDGTNESGVWECTPGRWRCEVDRHEFCHFMSGHSVYVSDHGERIEVLGGDAAWFPAGWKGECEVLETVRKTYFIR